MGYRIALITAIFLVFAGSFLAQRRIDAPTAPKVAPLWQCRRIVSMSPSITETLYALGLGDKVVGVTRDCHYPPEVEKVKKTGDIGGFYDPNLEAILTLKPDLVIMLTEHAAALPKFDRLNLETLVVSHQTVDGVIKSFNAIGNRCGKGPEARQITSNFRNRIKRIRKQTQGIEQPRVLFVLDRTFGRGRLADLYVAADDNYIDTIINWAGGQNACPQRGVRYPVVSTEGVLRLNPDVIVDMAPPYMIERLGRQAIIDDWKELQQVNAVKNGRVLIFEHDYAYIPGPRFLQFVEELAKRLHPKINWGKIDKSALPEEEEEE